MDYEPERIEAMYFVRYLERGKWHKTRYRLSEEEAKSRFAEYEILWDTKEDRKVGGDPDRVCTSAWLKKSDKP